MKILKRTIYLLGVAPSIFVGMVVWIFTGRDVVKTMLVFEDWCLKDKPKT